jgi:hypothetical protein
MPVTLTRQREVQRLGAVDHAVRVFERDGERHLDLAALHITRHRVERRAEVGTDDQHAVAGVRISRQIHASFDHRPRSSQWQGEASRAPGCGVIHEVTPRKAPWLRTGLLQAQRTQ